MRYLIFGAEGHIGRAITAKLHDEGHYVIVCPRGINPTLRGNMMDAVWDVSDRNEMARYAEIYKKRNHLDGIIYAVGHCPPNGFVDATKFPLSKLPLAIYEKEIEMHQLGVLNVFQLMLSHVEVGGCFLFLLSAITRMKGKFPPNIHADYHASVIAAEDWLIDGMRHDPAVQKRNIKIHRLAPAAVDTPFHHGGLKLPRFIPISDVANEAVLALESTKHIDKQIQ